MEWVIGEAGIKEMTPARPRGMKFAATLRIERVKKREK